MNNEHIIPDKQGVVDRMNQYIRTNRPIIDALTNEGISARLNIRKAELDELINYLEKALKWDFDYGVQLLKSRNYDKIIISYDPKIGTVQPPAPKKRIPKVQMSPEERRREKAIVGLSSAMTREQAIKFLDNAAQEK